MRRLVLRLAPLLLLAASVASAAEPSPNDAWREAADAVLECARADGGWTYVCNPPSGPHGSVTSILLRAQAIAARLGLADWDVLVLRSPGTPEAGLVMLDAWRRSGDARYLAAARRAGDILIEAQLSSGGWGSEMPVRGTRLPIWFRWLSHATALDDDVTSGAARFLLALWETTGDDRARAASERALDLLVAAQLADGAWPLTWRPAWLRALSPSFEDLPSTNDAATAGPIEALIAGGRSLANSGYLAAARRGGDWLLRVQGAEPQPAWAQQYDAGGRPGPGRRFEPAGFAAWESREMLDALASLAGATGEARYCAAIAPAVGWFARSAIARGCWARLYAPEDGRPLYAGYDGSLVASPAEARRPYKWIGDFGVPGFLASLGLDLDAKPLRPPFVLPLPPRRLVGDAGACAGAAPVEAAPDRENPRARIARAAVLLQRRDEPGTSPCAGAVASARALAEPRAPDPGPINDPR